jgi:hypothetical protein
MLPAPLTSAVLPVCYLGSLPPDQACWAEPFRELLPLFPWSKMNVEDSEEALLDAA